MFTSRQDGLLLFLALLKPVLRRNLPVGEAFRRMRGERWIPDATLEAMARELDEGCGLAEVMGGHPTFFPAPLPALLLVGERSGDPAGALERAIQLMRRDLLRRRQVASALVYPGICLLLILCLAALFVVVDPVGMARQIELATGESSPGAWLIHPLVLRLVVVAAVVGAVLAMRSLFSSRSRTARKDRMLLNLPVVGRLYRLSAAAAFTRSLGALLACGLPVSSALESAAPSSGNSWIEAELRRRLARVNDGEELAQALTLPGVFPPSLTWRLALGIEQGQLPQALDDAASAYGQDLAAYAGRLARTVEPAAIMAVGVIACVVIWLWFLPLQQIVTRTMTLG